MKIRNEEQLKTLYSAIGDCNHSVWLESVQGERYNMKDEQECREGLAILMSDAAEDYELFVNAREDTAILLQVCRQLMD